MTEPGDEPIEEIPNDSSGYTEPVEEEPDELPLPDNDPVPEELTHDPGP